MRGDNVRLHRLQATIDLYKSKLFVKTKQKFSKDINSFASKIVEVNGERKLYKENKEISTLTLKARGPKGSNVTVLAFGSRSVERSERSSQVPNNH